MNAAATPPPRSRLIEALNSGDASTRLKGALEIGSTPDPGLVESLIERCAVEPDFYVRDMLTWALIRQPSQVTVPALLAQLHSQRAQARSQALHTLSKIKEPSTWTAITQSLLSDADDEVARSAWRAAVILVPPGRERGLAEQLGTQLGRGDKDVQLSLSRALVALGADAIAPVLREALAVVEPRVHAHAAATERLLHDPKVGSERGINEAKRVFALSKER